MTATAQIDRNSLVETSEGFTALVRRVDAKSQRAVVVFYGEDAVADELAGYETMRRLAQLEPLRSANGRARKVKDLKAAIAAAREGALEL
jgi:hypothetical protein